MPSLEAERFTFIGYWFTFIVLTPFLNATYFRPYIAVSFPKRDISRTNGDLRKSNVDLRKFKRDITEKKAQAEFFQVAYFFRQLAQNFPSFSKKVLLSILYTSYLSMLCLLSCQIISFERFADFTPKSSTTDRLLAGKLAFYLCSLLFFFIAVR